MDCRRGELRLNTRICTHANVVNSRGVASCTFLSVVGELLRAVKRGGAV
jgi:hypothetical protein